MLSGDWYNALFVISGLLIQVLLVVNFAVRNWRPALEKAYGWLIYALGFPCLLLGLVFLAARQPWHLIAAPLIYVVWAGYASIVDRFRPVAWRSPPHWPIFIPYVALFMASQLAFWIPLWYIDMTYWIAYGVLYFANTGLNLYTHIGRRETGKLGTR